MGSRTKPKQAAPEGPSGHDATPERMAKGPSGLVRAILDTDARTGQRATPKARRMVPYLDILYNVGALTWAQHYAAGKWQEWTQDGFGNPRVCSDYGQSNGVRGSGDPSPLPLSDKAQSARDKLTAAQRALSSIDCDAIEEACKDDHEQLDRVQGAMRLGRWRRGLQALAVHLRVAIPT